MIISEQWLRLWIDPDASVAALCDKLTMAGLEVSSCEPVCERFTHVVIGEIIAIDAHANMAGVKQVRVRYTADKTARIVCGAANIEQGAKVALALPGAQLGNGTRIKALDLKGVVSEGMLCSASELGLSDNSDGILLMDPLAPLGMDCFDYFQLDDNLITIEITPNRGDCLSVVGVARELATLYRSPLKAQAEISVSPTHDDELPIHIEAEQDCPHYVGRVIKGIDQKAQAPLWMRERLRRSGLRSVSAVVDITNYVMLELGQPLHAFDLQQCQGAIHVRRAKEQESTTLLNGQDVTLSSDYLVIADAEKLLAVAGIMGSDSSAVSDKTVDVFLESAFFTPRIVANKARALGVVSDAAYRFERGVDPALQVRAIERATELMLSIVGGQPGPVIDASVPGAWDKPRTIALRRDRLKRVLGITLADDEVTAICQHLNLNPQKTTQGWDLTPPSYRFDIAVEIDCIEEIGRIVGYDQIPTPPVMLAAIDNQAQPEGIVSEARMASLLADRGYQEIITYSFIPASHQQALDPQTPPLALLNPLSQDMGVMRTTLWNGLLQAVDYNQKRQQNRLRFFEIGLRFIQQADTLVQENVLAGIATGPRYPEEWGLPGDALDFYDIKGDVCALLNLTGQHDDCQFVKSEHPALHPLQCAAIVRNGEPLGILGALHPRVMRQHGFDQGAIFVFELRMQALERARVPNYTELSKFPVIRRDLAFTIDEAVSVDALFALVKKEAGFLLKEIHLFDVYRGQKIAQGKKSVAIGLILQHDSRTLIDNEVNELMQKVVHTLENTFTASMRN